LKKKRPIRCPSCGECGKGYILTDPKTGKTARAILCLTHGVPRLDKKIGVKPILCPLDGRQGIAYEIRDMDSGEVSKAIIYSLQGIPL